MIKKFREDIVKNLESENLFVIAEYVNSLSDDDVKGIYDEVVDNVAYLFTREARVRGVEDGPDATHIGSSD